MRSLRVLAIAVGALLVAGAAGAEGPPSFHLVFDGKHNASLLHEGPFTTLASWCPSGSAADVTIDEATLTATRRFSCAGGGEFTAEVGPLPAEHGGSGSWRIIEGSGPLANLRGKGRFTSTRLSGSLDDPATVTFESTWDGVVDFDITPPSIGVTRSTVRKPQRPTGPYNIRLVLSLADTGGGPVSYTLQIVDPRKPPRVLAFKLGQATTGTVTLRFPFKVQRRTRVARLEIDASDAVGNAASLAKTIRLG